MCEHTNTGWQRYKDLEYGEHYTRTLSFTYCEDCGQILDSQF